MNGRSGMAALAALIRLYGARPNRELGNPGLNDSVLQLHVAEYSALTNRTTYWITLQFSVVATGVAAIGALMVLLQARPNLRTDILAWAVVVVAQATIGSYLYSMFEIMNTSAYVHGNLRARVRTLLAAPRADFWEFENFRRRAKVFSPAGVFFMMAWSLGTIVLALALLRPALGPVHEGGGMLSILLACWNFKLCRDVRGAHERLYAASESGTGS